MGFILIKTLMNRLISMSIRHQILLLVFIVASPAVGIILYSGLQMRETAIHDARIETQQLADNIAAEQKNLLNAAQQLIIALSQLPDVKNQNSARVEPVLRNILKLNTQYSNIFIADPKGLVWATAFHVKPPFVISDRNYFRNALARGQLASGEYVIGRATTRPVLNFGYPMRNDSSKIIGIINVGFLMEAMKEVLERAKLPAGANFVLLDHKGVVLYRAIGSQEYIGTPYNLEMFRQMQEGPDKDTLIGSTGSTGIPRIFSYRKLRLPGEQEPYMYIRAGIPVATVLAKANKLLFRNLSIFTAVLLLAIFFAWLIGKRSIADRINLLQKASLELAGGNLDIRVSELVSGGELGSLGRTFDAMAESLESQSRRRKISEEKYQTLFAESKDAIFVSTPEGRYLDINPAGVELYGYSSREEMLQLDINSNIYLQSEDRQAFRRIIEEQGFVKDFELRHKRKDGKILTILVSAIAVRDEHGNIAEYRGINRDITERKQTEAFREMGREILQILNEQGSLGDAIRRIITLLKRQTRCDAVGIRMQEGSDFPFFAHEGLSTDFIRAENSLTAGDSKDAVLTGRDGNVQLECACGLVIAGRTRPDNPLFTEGGSFWTNDSHALLEIPPDQNPLYHPRNRCIHQGYTSLALIPIRKYDQIVGLIHLSASRKGRFTLSAVELLEGIASHIGVALMRKQAEFEKEKLEAQLLQSQKMEAIGQLAGGVAHDFNNILAAVVSYSELLKKELKDNESGLKYVSEIQKGVSRGAALTHSLLAFGRKQHNNPQPMDLNEAIRDTENILTVTIGEDIGLSLILTGEITAVNADSNQITQILMNLSANSRDAMTNGGTLAIRTSRASIDDSFIQLHGYGSPGDYVLISVEDSGIGMDAATCARIFEPFFTTKAVGKGTGLGLSSVYGIVKQNNGFITVQSMPGAGTTFNVYLPALEKIEVSHKKEDHPVDECAAETILVVEDDSMLRHALTEMLQAAGYDVIEACDGDEAVTRFLVYMDGIHLVLMDVIMPQKNGAEVYRELKAIKPDLKTRVQ